MGLFNRGYAINDGESLYSVKAFSIKLLIWKLQEELYIQRILDLCATGR